MITLSWDILHYPPIQQGPDPSMKYIGKVKLSRSGSWGGYSYPEMHMPVGTIAWLIKLEDYGTYRVDFEGTDAHYRHSHGGSVDAGWSISPEGAEVIEMFNGE